MSWRKDRLRHVVRWGSDSEIREEVQRYFEDSWNKSEAVEDIIEVLKEEKRFDTVEHLGEVVYDGVRVRRSPYPVVEVDEDDDC